MKDKALVSIFMCCWVGEGPRVMILPWAPNSESRSLGFGAFLTNASAKLGTKMAFPNMEF